MLPSTYTQTRYDGLEIGEAHSKSKSSFYLVGIEVIGVPSPNFGGVIPCPRRIGALINFPSLPTNVAST